MPNFVPIELSQTTAAEREAGEYFAKTATCRACGVCVRHTRPRAFFYKAQKAALLAALKDQCPREAFCSPAEEVVPPGVKPWADAFGRWFEQRFDGKHVFGQVGELSKGVPVAVTRADDLYAARDAQAAVAILVRQAGWPVRVCGTEPDLARPVERAIPKAAKARRRKAAIK